MQKKANDGNKNTIRWDITVIVKYRGASQNVCNLRYKRPKESLVVFHNGSKYDYHFIIKELAKKLKGDFECSGENTEN